MKRFLIVLIALLTMVAFASVSDAAKKAKPKTATATGEVTAYEANASIEVQPAKGDKMKFAITGDTKVTGEVAVGAKVTVKGTKAADGTMTATAIKVIPVKKGKK